MGICDPQEPNIELLGSALSAPSVTASGIKRAVRSCQCSGQALKLVAGSAGWS